ncbi:nitrate reductase molybdenum cofactor assembly chaperone [Halopseudomonas nanhaiensis]|uniref:nitrate reductase molybdenum cofactor assembly chaperone n=1 Tax=Halopseudomonas nanhaiensis TaxID=2830842 RepID=UPI001CBCBB24|nr:nitrate reductase molybdenum cofactor assembly chaperone [Halopseudomonas nanhaiensis]UAW99346.1 nitrate reductase molybdenum cofactor assembly chaperone [Halopseudomonas nanhaiensis]
MQILKVISLLLDYPTAELLAAEDELRAAIAAAREISPEQRQALTGLLDQLAGSDVLDVQEHYTELFERGRYLSLLLFEHVHGESRDRGQAMVDLMAQYDAAGFAIGVRELPDYIPLYLEYLATRESIEAREGLADVAHLLALLASRLTERSSDYAACFTALLQIAGCEPSRVMEDVRAQIAAEQPDNSLEALDKEWEEEQVTFLNGDSTAACGTRPANVRAREDVAVPVHWVDFNDNAQPARRA